MRDKGLILAIVIPLVGLLPMFGEGLANAADAPFHAHRIFALARLIEAGDLYPRWVPYFHLGYGYPVFNYYAPGATHIGAWLHLLGFDVVTAYNFTTLIAWCIGSAGMWKLARAFLPASAACLACILWVYAPSRFSNSGGRAVWRKSSQHRLSPLFSMGSCLRGRSPTCEMACGLRFRRRRSY